MEISRDWRLKAQRYRLEGSACPTCGQITFPPRPICPHHTAQMPQTSGYGLVGMPASNHTVDHISSKG